MPIHWVKRSIFDTDATILVNTINCVSVMGKGIALEFKNRYPEMFLEYKKMCRIGGIKPGDIFIYPDKSGNVIVNMATKNHWRYDSKYEWVESGISKLTKELIKLGDSGEYPDVALPYPGCGNGNLEKDKVAIIINSHMKDLQNNIFICDL